jgi:hypothetical protein
MYYVPSDMKYSAWHEKYVKDSKHIGEKEDSPRKDTKGKYGVKWSVIDSKEYKESFDKITDNPKVNEALYVRAKWALNNRGGLDTEELYAINAKTGDEAARITNQNISKGVERGCRKN